MSAAVIEALRAVQKDCRSDAVRTEGLALTGRNVGELFGSTLAMIATVARAVELLSEDVAALQRTLDARAVYWLTGERE